MQACPRGFWLNLIPPSLPSPALPSDCGLCNARAGIQRKYLGQMEDLYDDFHLVRLPLLPKEVRGPDAIKEFSEMLIHPVSFNTPKPASEG